MDIKRPKGYIPSHERNCCEECKYFFTNMRTAAKQDRVFQCTKVEPPFEVSFEDICDEYEENKF